jgi:uncharacterized membrane protein
MDEESGDDRYTEATSLIVLGVGLAALFLDVSNWWLVFVLGYAVVVPLVALLTGEDDDVTDDVLSETNRRMDDALRGRDADDGDVPPSKRDALDTLRERYAQGELSEEQFEAKLEHLLETETLEDARDTVERSKRTRDETESAPRDDARDRDPALERE